MLDKEKHLEYIKKFTDVYRLNKHLGKEKLEVECLKVQYPFMLQPIQHGDLFVGRYEYPAVYFLPQTYSRSDGAGFGYIFDDISFEKLRNSNLTVNERNELDDLKIFWESENTVAKMKSSYPEEMRKILYSDNWTTEPGVAFPLYRMAGSILNYDYLLSSGISGIEDEIIKRLDTADEDSFEFYGSLIEVLNLFKNCCRYYAEQLQLLYHEIDDRNRREHLSKLIEALLNIQNHKPACLLEAIQLMFLYNSISGSLNFGRMDEYLGDFLVNDLAMGNVNLQMAQTYMNGLWKMIIARNTAFDGRIIIGGKGRRNEENADQLALMAMESTRLTNNILPQLMLRWYDGMDERLLEKALQVIKEGNTYPMLYNDDANIPSVMNAFNIDYEDAVKYSPYGCGEYVIHNRSFGTPSGVINLLKSLEITLNEGYDKVSDQDMGLDLGNADDFKTYDDLWNAYKKQTEYFIDQLALQEKFEYKIAGESAQFLFLSLLYDDCIERGKGIFNGGIRYLGGTLETYGNTNTSDSLTAIKKLVYEEKRFALSEIKNMISTNFEGFAKERQIILGVPKYGNDDDYADEIAQEVHEHVCNYAKDQKYRTLLHNYLVVVINNNANTVLGRNTMASADGRLAYTSMANANAASGGADKNGITALLNSLVKLDPSIHAGSVQNLKISKNMLENHRDHIVALIKGYFKSKGTQLMLTVLSKDDLKNARMNPVLYPNLLVRVGGYSARFVDLESDIQDEIISRTLY